MMVGLYWNSDVASYYVYDGGVVPEEYTLIDFQSHSRISVDEDCVPCECIGHRHIVIKWVVLRMLCMKKFLKVFNIGNVVAVVSKKVLVL